jgi:hypothetical protein
LSGNKNKLPVEKEDRHIYNQLYPELSDAQLEYVVEKIKAFYLKKS